MAEPLHATFFALKKRDGSLLAPASIAFAVAIVVGFVVLGAIAYFLLGGASFVQWYSSTMTAASKGIEPSPPPNMGAIFLIFPIEMVALFFYFILIAAFEAACLRWMIRGEKSGPLNLSFGADMWRVYGTYWFWFLFFFITGIVFIIWMFVLGLIGAALGGQSNPMAVGGVILLGCLLWFVAWIVVAVRLAPAAATSVGAGHFAPMKAWSVSRDRFWALFGAFLLLFVIYIVVSIVVSGVALGSYYSSIFGSLDWSLMRTNPSAFSAAYQSAALSAAEKLWSDPAHIAVYLGANLIGFALALVFCVLLYGINARAVQAALGDGKLAHEPPAP